ncbi:FAD-binding protein [Tabrizicola sp.]|uniref:FAD-binding protein n=1 Tax=Tabrizicola sp. TaxID=2005166 RepID=UPI003D2A3FB3
MQAFLAACGAAALRPDDGCTFPWPIPPLGVIRPPDADAAAANLALAGRMGVPLHPVSRGRSWGLGSAMPPREAVILDLSGLDRVLDMDVVHGTVRVEPGVTFRQLEAALTAVDAPFHIPAFGGPPDASVLANSLERGEGSGAMGDRFAHLWDLDVALSTGERLRTGHARHGMAHLSALHARPAGPLLEGLLSQTSAACVLSGRLALARTPRFAAYLGCDLAPDRVGDFVKAVRLLMHEDVLAAHDVFFWDGAKRLSSAAIAVDHDPGPFSATDLRAWSASIAISASHQMLFDCRMALALSALTPLAVAIEVFDESGDLASGLRGRSDGANLVSCYWAKPALGPAPLNPDRDRCGFLWLCPVLPFEPEALLALSLLVQQVVEAHGIFIATGAEAATARALIGYVSLAWDRDEPGADARALRAHDDLFNGLWALGFGPYRLALPTRGLMPAAQDAWEGVATRLRAALDPGGQFGAGR